jgi:uncharacterized protein YjdB
MQKMRRPSGSLVAAVGLAAALAAGACESDDPLIVRGPSLTTNPASLDLAAGATREITATVRAGAGGAPPTWAVADGAVARLDSVAAAGTRAFVRAVAPGATVLTVRAGGATTTVPVLVR